MQIIKGWLDAAGKTHEKVYDVAWSGDRKPGQGWQAAAGGKHGGRDGSDLHQRDRRAVPAPRYWQDPSFDPKQRAFYYVRVIEIPTPRWTTYDAKFFG